MVNQFARQTAIPCTLAELKSGEWLQNDGLVPSGIKLSRGIISRVSILGVLIDKEDNAFSLDDGTGMIRVRSFDTAPAPIRASIGDLVIVIARPREYNNERFLVLEICKRLKNPSWIKYRKHELASLSGITIIETVEQQTRQPPMPAAHHIEIPATPVKNPFETIIDKIRELDSGSGADVDEVLSYVKIDEAEKYIRTLIEEGEIFEPRPGKVKVLE